MIDPHHNSPPRLSSACSAARPAGTGKTGQAVHMSRHGSSQRGYHDARSLDPIMLPTRPARKTRSVGEVESFIALLRAACDDRSINDTLEKLLSQNNTRRQALVHSWVSDLLLQEAPRDFTLAIACLMDDAVADKAYEVIFQCRRPCRLARALQRI